MLWDEMPPKVCSVLLVQLTSLLPLMHSHDFANTIWCACVQTYSYIFIYIFAYSCAFTVNISKLYADDKCRNLVFFTLLTDVTLCIV